MTDTHERMEVQKLVNGNYCVEGAGVSFIIGADHEHAAHRLAACWNRDIKIDEYDELAAKMISEADKTEAAIAALVEVVEWEAAHDCYQGEECGKCQSCKARAVLKLYGKEQS